ncbi:MAG: hypothetical protein GX786_07955, partial [Clostridiales bacterium]|nr:hypothetical protein [Clostridiales bacterium]
MKRIGTLMKLELLQLLYPLRIENLKKGLTKKIAITIALLISLGTLLGMVIYVEIQLIPPFVALGIEKYLLIGLVFFTQVLTLFFSFFRSAGLFLGKDKELIFPLPVKSKEIFTAKVISNIVAYWAMTFLLFFPCGIVYGIKTDQGLWYYLLAFLGTMLLPVIPVSVSTFITGLLSSAIKKVKHKEQWLMIISVLFIIAVVILPMLFTGSQKEELDIAQMMLLISQQDQLIKKVVTIFPPAVWMANGLYGELINMVYFVLSSVLCFGAVVFLFGNNYQNKMMKMGEVSTTSQKKQRLRIPLKKSPVKAVFYHEWKQVLRSAAYALNGLIGIILFPIMIGMMIFSGKNIDMGQMNFLIDQTLLALPNEMFLWISALVGLFCAMVNPAGATAVSREGKFHDFHKIFPVSGYQQIMGKQWFGFSVSAIGAALSTLILC